MPSASAPLVAADEIARFVGPAASARGQEYSRSGAVADIIWNDEEGLLVGSVLGTAARPYRCRVTLVPARAGFHRPTASTCTCPVGSDCKHAAAAMFESNRRHVRQLPMAATVTTAGTGTGTGTAATATATATALEAPTWRTQLMSSIPGTDTAPESVTPLGLLFELRCVATQRRHRWQAPSATTAKAPIDPDAEYRLAVRPVIRADTGNWVRGGITWNSMSYQGQRLGLDPTQHRWFAQFGALARSTREMFDLQESEWLYLDDFESPLLWRLLDDAARAGISLVSGKKATDVRVGSAADVGLAVEREFGRDASAGAALDDPVAGSGSLDRTADHGSVDGGGAHGSLNPAANDSALVLDAVLTIDGEPVPRGGARAIGTHGIYVAEFAPRPSFLLAPTVQPLGEQQRRILRRPAVRIPPADVDEFIADFYPRLARSITVMSMSVDLPELRPPELQLTATFEPGRVLRLEWAWLYDGVARPIEGIADAATPRDTTAQAVPLERVRGLVGEVTPAVRTGIDAAQFAAEVLPTLRELPLVRVVVVGDQPDYRELTDAPHMTITATETDRRDWFDLGVVVTVEGKTVPFTPLFAALSKGRKKLLLADNSYLSLQHPAFDELKRLIDEASQLAEWETGPRISRYQADLWSEFEDLADETVAAKSWRAAARGLLDAASIERIPVPVGVAAELRPYQRDGLDWLVFLRRHGLGGILADDMGLGKTLQTLALIAEAKEAAGRENPPASTEGNEIMEVRRSNQENGNNQRNGNNREKGSRQGTAPDNEMRGSHADLLPDLPPDLLPGRSLPFLVVAPTSVVSNWASEAARYTPGLAVRSITATEGKARRSIRDAADGADIVVTSYALFRLDFAAYQGVTWGGLVLDEAQFVKNPDSQAHRCAIDLDAPVKIALTGTPLENSLVDLWALFAIVAPGLFPSRRRFTEEYVMPISRGDDREHAAERTVKLRRRIHPLMMRRTKERVASELPAKQEQALHVDLEPRHRALYDTYLQRERQKLLGLVDDLDRNRFIVFRSLTLLRMLSLDASLIDDEYAGIPSAKLDALLEQLDDVVAEGHRALVFSQFTSFLKLAATRLDAAGITYEYLDGSTLRRASVIERFRGGDAPVFLISLKAGGFGLNLTEADYVFLLDPWWNPASESQAVDRTHRIGQTKPVNVYRMVSSGTIEEKVMALRDRKAALFDAVMEDDAVFSSALTADDIRGLLQD